LESAGKMIDAQDILINEVKRQCALIEVKTNPQGHQTFDLPAHLKRSQTANKARKDNYTAMLLGAWGVKAYWDMQDYKSLVIPTTFTPIFIP